MRGLSYIEDDDFEILLFGYAFGDDEVRGVDFKKGEALPKHLLEAPVNPEIIKTAFNANFERT